MTATLGPSLAVREKGNSMGHTAHTIRRPPPSEDKRSLERDACARGATVTTIIQQAVEEYVALPVGKRDAGGSEELTCCKCGRMRRWKGT